MPDLSLEGRVVTASGDGRADVAVSIRRAPASVPDLSALTDGSGRFTLHDLPAGRYELFFMPPDGRGQVRAVTLDGTTPLYAFVLDP